MDVRLNLSMDVGLSTPLTVRAAQARTTRRTFSKFDRRTPAFLREARLSCILLIGLALLNLPVHALNPDRNLSQFGLRTWQTDSGLPQNSVRAILQTRDGYLWF